MAMTQASVVVGVFPERSQAQCAVDELRRAGFSDEEIGFLTRASVADTGEDVGANTATGVAGGGLVGGLMGAAAALLIPGFGPAIAGGILAAVLGGAALGAAAGGLLGAFTSIGVSDTDARFYQNELNAGRSIVTVKAPTGLEDAEVLLRNCGASNVKTHIGIINTTSALRPPDTFDPTTNTPSNSEPQQT